MKTEAMMRTVFRMRTVVTLLCCVFVTLHPGGAVTSSLTSAQIEETLSRHNELRAQENGADIYFLVSEIISCCKRQIYFLFRRTEVFASSADSLAFSIEGPFTPSVNVMQRSVCASSLDLLLPVDDRTLTLT